MDRLVVILVAQVFNGCLLPFFSICLLLCINDEQFMGRCESQISFPRNPCQHLSQVPSEGLAQHIPCDWRHNHPPARQQRHRAEGEKDFPKTKHGENLNSHCKKKHQRNKTLIAGVVQRAGRGVAPDLVGARHGAHRHHHTLPVNHFGSQLT